jgi:hypothetical protein
MEDYLRARPLPFLDCLAQAAGPPGVRIMIAPEMEAHP